MRSSGFAIVKPIVKTGPMFASRNCLIISLIVINLCSCTVSGMDQNISLTPDTWLNDTESGYDEIIENCLDKCSVEDKYFENIQAVGCQSYKDLCSKGCSQWKLSTFSTCKHVCHDDTWNSNLSPCDLACISGCNQAINGIKGHLRQQSHFMTSLVLANDTDNATSLLLSWPIDQNIYSTERLVLQWTYADVSQKWTYSSNFHWVDNYTCIIEKLQPYTRYRFRVAMMVTTDHSNFVHSVESEIFQTLPMGAPTSPPEITEVLALDHDKIAVFWKEGRFINAPLEGYHVKAVIVDADENSTSEVIIPSSENYTILHHLQPQQSYEIEVSMVNSFGKGPSATTVASTGSISTEIMSPVFIAVGEFKVNLLNTSTDGSTAKELYKSDYPIVGFDILIGQQVFFVSDDSGYVYMINMNNEAERDAIVSPKSVANFKPSKLSVDWLNSHLYILGEGPVKSWLIARTGFGGNGLKLIAEGLTEEPLDLYVDPLNGFLFWITLESGIYRLDLVGGSWGQIFKKEGLTTFTIDPKNFFFIALSKTNRTFLKISYDGRVVLEEDIEVSSDVVVDLVYHGSNLYWTDGDHIYRNHSITVLFDSCKFLKLFQPSAQPTIAATEPPGEVQALLTADKAKLTWKGPRKKHFQGSGAWKAWTYDLEVREGEVSVSIRNIKTEFFTVEKLKPNTEYWFRVRPTNLKAPDGPWSKWFVSKTWTLSEDRYLLLASENGLLRSDEVGDDLEILVNGSISSLTWANGTLYLVKNSQLNRLEMSNLTAIVGETRVESVAYDWKGRKLYFTDRSKGIVIRMNLDGTERELLPILEVKHMELDSGNGYIYYSTGLRIEGCRLSGKGCMTYFRTSLFSEEDLIGPALDLKNEQIFWMTQSDHDAFLFSATMVHGVKTADAPIMTPLERFPYTNWFSHLSGRFLWSTSDGSLVLGNEKAENHAVLRFKEMMHEVKVIEPSLEVEAFNRVIPDAVDNSTIKVIGFWDKFNITWEPVHNEEGSNISYSLKIGDKVFLESSEASVQYPLPDLPPFSPMKVWITSSSPWNTGPTTTAEIYSPTAAPSEPQRLRVFINRSHNPLQGGQNISAIVRWDAPEEPNGPIVLYSISCMKGEELQQTQNSSGFESKFFNLEENTTYLFQAQAFTSGAGGATSEPLKITVNSEYQSIPKILVANDDQIVVLDMDINSTEVLVETNRPAVHLAVLREENRILWINGDGELRSFDGKNESVLSFLESEVQALTVDWISRIVFWSQSDHGGGSTIHFLDLNRFEGKPLGGQLLISNPKPIKDLVILSFSQTLLWLELDGSLSGWNLRDLSEINLLLGTDLSFQRMYPGRCEDSLETVILVDEKEGICVFDLRTETCKALKVGVDSQNLRLAWDNGFVYSLKNHSIRAYNRRKEALEYMVKIEGVNEITALSIQPYPESKCLLPDYGEEPLVETNLLVPQVVNSTKHSLELQLPRISPPPGCGFKIPGLKYTILLKEEGKEEALTRNLHSFDAHTNVTDLKPYTKYLLQLQVSNYYAEKFGLPAVLGPGVDFITAPGTPSMPRNVTVSAVSPRDGLVEWIHPEVLNNDKVWYEIHWQTENPTNGVVHRHQKIVPEGEDKWNSFLMSSLRPDQTYLVWIKVFSTESAFNTSATYQFETFPEPEGLAFVNSTAYSLTLSWNCSVNVTSAFLLYSPLDVDDPVSVNITNDSRSKIIESLEPKTKYSFHLKLFYSHSVHPYVWPPDNRFTFETLGDRPSAPGQPLIEHIKGEVFKIFWEPARSNGAPIEEYSLEALQSSQVKRVKRSHYYAQDDDLRVSNKTLARLGQLPWAEEIAPIQDKWIPYCNGTETNCIITELHTMRLLMFRGRARNSYGWGPYSPDSEMIAEPFVLPRKRDTLVFAIIAPITIVSTCVSMAVLIRYIHSRRKHAKKLLYESRPSIWGLDVATLQQVARSRNFSQTSSMLYTGKPLTDGDIALLPQIGRGQISMQKFLGSGAFGEVYEGLVTYTEDGTQDRVAIKTLRKGANDQEKTELLQEAHLMSHFKHENIVNLIGVCFDLDSICIIMELMEGGDLQTYLRHARPTLSKLGTLSLLDLVTMCLDVCTGCRYLEDLHFLHRDLACRNCLVSSIDPRFRVVKIGDFGLARDIYKSDYYRKEGEGLLPVRWMAPECLVDGVFTSQSDIWSFGILLWEILSLGQQPYPAQSNLEVLNFVKEGGRLQQPQECPNRLYKLMLQCWSHESKDRPTFQQCLNELLSLKLEILNLKHTKEYKGGITNMSFAESDDEDDVSRISISSKGDNPSSLNSSFIGNLKSNQRSHIADGGSELSSFKASAPSEAGTNGTQLKRKSVHYVNEGRSRF